MPMLNKFFSLQDSSISSSSSEAASLSSSSETASLLSSDKPSLSEDIKKALQLIKENLGSCEDTEQLKDLLFRINSLYIQKHTDSQIAACFLTAEIHGIMSSLQSNISDANELIDQMDKYVQKAKDGFTFAAEKGREVDIEFIKSCTIRGFGSVAEARAYMLELNSNALAKFEKGPLFKAS